MAIPSRPFLQCLLLTFKLFLLRYPAAIVAEMRSPGKDYFLPSLPSNDPAPFLALPDAARAFGLESAARLLRSVPGRRQFLFTINDLLNLGQEPRVDPGKLEQLREAEAGAQGVAEEEDALGVGHAEVRGDQFVGQDVAVGIDFVAEPPRLAVAAQAIAPDLQRAQGLLQRFLERAANRHHLADALHLRVQRRVSLGELLKGEARDFGDDVINGRLEAGGRFAGDVVPDLIEQVADGEFGGDLGDRKARGLGSQGGGTRHAWVHLDDNQAAIVRVYRELDVRPAGFDADRADHREGGVAHDLEFLVRERLDGRHRDRIAGMDAHGVEVLYGADDDAVVVAVAHDLHLELLPAQQRLLDQDFGHGRQFEAALGHFVELLPVVSDAAAGAAECKRWADDQREPANLLRDLARFFGGVSGAADGHVEADGQHQILEHLAVLAALDGLGIGADHLDAVFVERPAPNEGHGGIEGGLAAEGRQQNQLAVRPEALQIQYGLRSAQ